MFSTRNGQILLAINDGDGERSVLSCFRVRDGRVHPNFMPGHDVKYETKVCQGQDRLGVCGFLFLASEFCPRMVIKSIAVGAAGAALPPCICFDIL